MSVRYVIRASVSLHGPFDTKQDAVNFAMNKDMLPFTVEPLCSPEYDRWDLFAIVEGIFNTWDAYGTVDGIVRPRQGVKIHIAKAVKNRTAAMIFQPPATLGDILRHLSPMLSAWDKRNEYDILDS